MISTIYFKLSSISVSLNLNTEDSLAVYKDNFERAYVDDTERFYKSRAPQVLFCMTHLLEFCDLQRTETDKLE